MRNITALTVLVIIINTFAVINSVYCQETAGKNYSFSIAPQVGFVYGQALEYVYPMPNDTKGEYLSELQWDMKSVFYLGARADFGRVNPFSATGFYSSLSFKAGIPSDSGILENRDWMSTENDGLTHFSSHTNRTRGFFILDAVAGVSLPVKSRFLVKPFVSGRWMHFSFTGRDGQGTYARPKGYSTYYSIDDDPTTHKFEDDVIRYKQDWFLLSPGISAGAKISAFMFNLSFQASPLSYCASKDEHLTTKAVYLDYTRMGFFLEPAAGVSLTVRRLEFLFEFTYMRIGNTRGETYINEDNSGYYRAFTKAGAGLSLLDTRFLVKFRL